VIDATPSRPARQRRRRAVAALVLAAVATALAVTHPWSQPRGPATLGDLWSGHARLQLAHMWTSASLGDASGTRIVVVDGTWYLFSRHTGTGSCAGYSSMPPMSIQVRASHDQGGHWGRPVTILAPTPGTPWSCEATDGGVAYDASAQTWRIVFQCRGDGTPWNGCYAERRGKSPLGPFRAPAGDTNPVIASGALWSRICADPGDRCAGPSPVVDEGTFDLFEGTAGSWWVGFHGWDGSHAYRGLARTSTFRPEDWQVDGVGGTPKDAVLGPADAAGWRETWHGSGPVGAGAGTILGEGDRYYQLAEFPDQSLSCQAGQTWDLGLFRTDDLASTSWQQYPPGNPIVVSSREPDASGASMGCSVEYPDLFRDDATGTTYVMYLRLSADPAKNGLYLYKVAWDDDLLANGDFALDDTQGWTAFPGTGTQIDVPRTPDQSWDGTPFLSLNCGGTCQPSSGVYQDVPAGALRGGQVAFSGRFAAAGSGAKLSLSLLQLDAAGRVVRASRVRVAPDGTWRGVGGHAKVDRRAARLRLQIYIQAPQTVHADDLSVRRTG
jgi:hypothetical protein